MYTIMVCLAALRHEAHARMSPSRHAVQVLQYMYQVLEGIGHIAYMACCMKPGNAVCSQAVAPHFSRAQSILMTMSFSTQQWRTEHSVVAV